MASHLKMVRLLWRQFCVPQISPKSNENLCLFSSAGGQEAGVWIWPLTSVEYPGCVCLDFSSTSVNVFWERAAPSHVRTNWTACHIVCYLICSTVIRCQHMFTSVVVKSLLEIFQTSYNLLTFRLKNQSRLGKKRAKVDVNGMKACRENTGINPLNTELNPICQ
jgi:hypothetical protein